MLIVVSPRVSRRAAGRVCRFVLRAAGPSGAAPLFPASCAGLQLNVSAGSMWSRSRAWFRAARRGLPRRGLRRARPEDVDGVGEAGAGQPGGGGGGRLPPGGAPGGG